MSTPSEDRLEAMEAALERLRREVFPNDDDLVEEREANRLAAATQRREATIPTDGKGVPLWTAFDEIDEGLRSDSAKLISRAFARLTLPEGRGFREYPLGGDFWHEERGNLKSWGWEKALPTHVARDGKFIHVQSGEEVAPLVPKKPRKLVEAEDDPWDQ